jgi:hypothetical protein
MNALERKFQTFPVFWSGKKLRSFKALLMDLATLWMKNWEDEGKNCRLDGLCPSFRWEKPRNFGKRRVPRGEIIRAWRFFLPEDEPRGILLQSAASAILCRFRGQFRVLMLAC